MSTKKQYKLNYLSPDFYLKYDKINHPEIEIKENRPYIVILIEIKSNIFAIPFRTNIRHNNCYRFKNSTRETNSVTGIDYTKAVIVNDNKYIGEDARINDKEYIELNNNYKSIIKQFQKYVEDYVKYITNKENGYYKEEKFKYTTLQYFHNELGINIDK